MRRLAVLLAIALVALIFAGLIRDYTEQEALRPLAGSLTTVLFGAGLLGASLLAAAIVPLATAYSIAEGIGSSRNPAMLAEHVRARIQRQICAQHTSPGGYLPLIAQQSLGLRNFPMHTDLREAAARPCPG